MKNNLDNQATTLGERIKRERQNLGLTQEAFAEIGGVKRATQYNYEQDKQFPDVGYLQQVGNAGANVHYIITGEASPYVPLPKDEHELLSAYRASTAANKKQMRGIAQALGGVVAPAVKKERVKTLPQPSIKMKAGSHSKQVGVINGGASF